MFVRDFTENEREERKDILGEFGTLSSSAVRLAGQMRSIGCEKLNELCWRARENGVEIATIHVLL